MLSISDFLQLSHYLVHVKSLFVILTLLAVSSQLCMYPIQRYCKKYLTKAHKGVGFSDGDGHEPLPYYSWKWHITNVSTLSNVSTSHHCSNINTAKEILFGKKKSPKEPMLPLASLKACVIFSSKTRVQVLYKHFSCVKASHPHSQKPEWYTHRHEAWNSQESVPWQDRYKCVSRSKQFQISSLVSLCTLQTYLKMDI